MQIEAEERVPFLYTAVALACAASGALIARAAADTLFLDYYGTDFLSVMYMGTGLLVGGLAYLFARHSRSVPFHRLLALSCGLLALSAVVLRACLLFSWNGARILTYFWSDLSVSGSMLLFWSFFSQVYNVRQARRLLGWISAAGTFACILSGFLIRPFTQLFGTANLLILVALLFLVFAWSASHLARRYSNRFDAHRETGRSEVIRPHLTYYFRLLARPRVRILAAQAAVGMVVVVLIDYLFKVIARTNYQGPALAAFFGNFYGTANIIVLAIQIFTVHRLLQGKRLWASLSVLPAGLLAGSAAMLLSASFWIVVSTKLVVQTTLFTIDSAAWQMLFLGLKQQTRTQVRALVEGMCKPFAVGATGAAVTILAGAIHIRILAFSGLLLCSLWLFLARRNYISYVEGLLENLRAKRLDSSEQIQKPEEKAVENYMRKALPTARVEGLHDLMGLVHELGDVDWLPEIRALLQRPEPEIRVAALEYLSQSENEENLDQFVEHLRDPDARVRRAAVRGASVAGQRAASLIREALGDSDPCVRAEAASVLAEINHLSGLEEGTAAIKEMLESQDKFRRAAVATLVSRLRIRGQTQFLLQLIRDPEPEVRLAALKAFGRASEAALVPPALSQLWDARTADAAAEALTELGPLTVAYLLEAPNAEEVAAIFCRSDRVSHILAKIGTPGALQVLKRVLDTSTRHSPSSVIRAYSRILQRQRRFSPHQQHWESAIHCQLEAARQRRRMLVQAASLPENALLVRALREECERHLDHILLLVGCRAKSVRMEEIHAQMHSCREEERIRALEFLEHVIPTKLRPSIMDLIEDRRWNSTGNGAEPLLMEILRAETSESILLGAIYSVLQSRCRDALPLVRQYLSHGSEIVRETAQHTLAQMEPSESTITLGGVPMRAPKDVLPRGRCAERNPQPPKGGAKMIVVEKMLFLGNVPLFSKIGAEELANIASIAREASYPAGQPIIREGEYGDHMFLIVDGEVLIHHGQTSVKMLGPTEFFGEMSIIDGEPRSASATAFSDCLLLRIDKEDFHEFHSTHSSVGLSMIRVLVQRIRELLPALERVEKGM